MNEIITKLNDSINAYHITLEDLVQNIRENNYRSVLYKKTENGIHVITECSINNREDAAFVYFFNMDELLETVKMIVNGQETIYYSRVNEVDAIKTKILNTISTQDLAV
jgi:hypothetical protein